MMPLSWREKAALALFPRRCAFCGAVIEPEELLCEACKANAPRILPPLCAYCGANRADCSCRKHRMLYEQMLAPFYYEGGAANGITQLKFYDKPHRAEYFGIEMARLVRGEYGKLQFDLVCCVPISAQRLRERGYNQSALLGQIVARELDLPFAEQLLQKLHNSSSQRDFSIHGRRANILGTIAVTQEPAVANKRILLVDDVSTTGATLQECAKMLLLEYAAAVYCVTACKTKRK